MPTAEPHRHALLETRVLMYGSITCTASSGDYAIVACTACPTEKNAAGAAHGACAACASRKFSVAGAATCTDWAIATAAMCQHHLRYPSALLNWRFWRRHDTYGPSLPLDRRRGHRQVLRRLHVIASDFADAASLSCKAKPTAAPAASGATTAVPSAAWTRHVPWCAPPP
jgi:hypothetical protein